MRTQFHRTRIILAIVVSALMLGIQPASAAPPVEVVHTEKIQAGPYAVAVSFSEWPLRAERSLDFLFEPTDGITGSKAFLRPLSPTGELTHLGSNSPPLGAPLARHPRARHAWGLDIVALPTEGTWKFELTVVGPRGTGTGTLPMAVGPRPGPPATLSWLVGLLPLIALPPLGFLAWTRSRSYRLVVAKQWASGRP